MSSTNTNSPYIYNLPHLQRKELCRILDQGNQWEELAAAHMHFDTIAIEELRKEICKGGSPTDALLTLWGHLNHTTLELFILLKRMRHYQAMLVIKPFIDPKYHSLIRDGNHNLQILLQRLTVNKDREEEGGARVKSLRVPVDNFDPASEKILNVDKNLMVETRDVNHSIEGPNVFLQPKSPLPLGRYGASGFTVSDISCITESAGAIPQISYEELQKATNEWSPATILGKGGFGTVFKGTWKCTLVAVKRIESREDDSDSRMEQIKQSITELHCLNAYRHDNVLPLYGYSVGGPQPCLVYQYMCGGSLDYRLRMRHADKLLPWPKRLAIAIGTARGLQFLHTIGAKPLIHGDIKAANILLDKCDQAKIGDFGLAREGPHSDYTHLKVSRIHGTRPYLPDEFLRAKKISTKVDTYSFGVVLFELATALAAYATEREHKFLKDHVMCYEGDVLDLRDRRIADDDECFRRMLEVGKVCVNKRPKDRPEMVQVLMLLEEIGCAS